jgi:hypothetical protein
MQKFRFHYSLSFRLIATSPDLLVATLFVEKSDCDSFRVFLVSAAKGDLANFHRTLSTFPPFGMSFPI